MLCLQNNFSIFRNIVPAASNPGQPPPGKQKSSFANRALTASLIVLLLDAKKTHGLQFTVPYAFTLLFWYSIILPITLAA